MKIKLSLITTGVILAFVLMGCGKSKLETENDELKTTIAKSEDEKTVLKSQISRSESDNKILMSQIELLKQQTNLDVQLKIEIESELDNYKQQIKDLQDRNAEKTKQAQSDKSQLIKTGVEKIEAHLKKVFNEPQNFNSSDKNERGAELERLKQSANAEKAQVEVIIADLDGADFDKKQDLEQSVNKFFSAYGYWIERAKDAADWKILLGESVDKFSYDNSNQFYQDALSSEKSYSSTALNEIAVIAGYENTNQP
jgi:chromosome segregation ATPase